MMEPIAIGYRSAWGECTRGTATLAHFLAAADALHFTRAAETLNVSQPTLSLQIQELERELGAPLFDRVGRSVRLTAAGAVFRRHAARALQEAEMGREAVADLLGLRGGGSGWVSRIPSARP